MSLRLTIAIGLAAAASCNSAPPRDLDSDDASTDTQIDEGPPDARTLGALDGECTGQPGRPRVLVYTYENQWRHLSNYYARAAVGNMCVTRGFNIKITNDPHAINATRLAETDVVVFSVTSGSGLTREAKQDFEAWVRAGGEIVGFEAATATEQGWQFYADNLGAEFYAHAPGVQLATMHLDPTHPITQGLGAAIDLTEQWYTFKNRPETVPGLQVLMTLDESTLPADFPPELKLGYHAIGWVHEPFGGRVFYTGIGDLPGTFDNPIVLEIIGRAIEWTARAL